MNEGLLLPHKQKGTLQFSEFHSYRIVNEEFVCDCQMECGMNQSTEYGCLVIARHQNTSPEQLLKLNKNKSVTLHCFK